MQLPVWCGYETAVLPVAAAYHGERRSLHPSDRVVGRAGNDGQGTAGVHAHQPVGLRTAVGGGIEAVVSASLPEVRHALADGLVGKRGDPQPSEGLGIAQIRIYPPEDKFPLAARVRCHDDAVAFGEYFINDFELFAGGDVRHHPPVRAYLPWHKAERFGNHREVFGGGPRVAVCSRQCQRH